MARGATAEVWRAFDTRLERTVAVKRLVTGTDPVTASRLEREARTVAGLSHPGIVTVYDTGIEDGLPWLAMELVDGESLADLLVREGRIEHRRAVAIAIQIARALEHAHEAGLIHRDVKPANIMLRADGRAQLVDFGITAGDGDARLTSTGMVVGSAAYLAPEVAAGSLASPASDIYSLGAVLFEMVSGRSPFPGSTLSAVLLAHQQEPVPSVVGLGGVPPWLDRVLSRALAKQPRDRHVSAGGFADDLAQGERGSRATDTIAMPAFVPPGGADSPGPVDDSDGDPASRRRKVIAGVAAALLLATVAAFAMDGDPEEDLQALESTTTVAETTTTQPPETTAAPTTTEETTRSVSERISDVRDQIVGAVDASPIKNKTAKDLVEKVDDAVDAFQEEKLDEAAEDLEDAYSIADKIDIPIVEGLIERAIEQLADLMGLIVEFA